MFGIVTIWWCFHVIEQAISSWRHPSNMDENVKLIHNVALQSPQYHVHQLFFQYKMQKKKHVPLPVCEVISWLDIDVWLTSWLLRAIGQIPLKQCNKFVSIELCYVGFHIYFRAACRSSKNWQQLKKLSENLRGCPWTSLGGIRQGLSRFWNLFLLPKH